MPCACDWFFSSLHMIDRKSTRLNSSHGYISYAVFCLKKKKKISSLQRIGSVVDNSLPGLGDHALFHGNSYSISIDGVTPMPIHRAVARDAQLVCVPGS